VTSKYQALIQLFCGHFELPGPDSSLAAYGAYLAGHGVEFTSSEEMCKVNHPELLDPDEIGVRKIGEAAYLLPNQGWWERGAALALIADECRRRAGEPYHLRNWYRPPKYNAAVKGAANSAHTIGAAIDCDLQSKRALDTWMTYLSRWVALDGIINMSLGIGRRTVHIGLDDVRRANPVWYYASAEE
jgi:hypothetical protein